MRHFIETRPAGHVSARVRQGQPAPIQGDIDRVHDGRVERLGVIAVRFIHPSLAGGKETELSITFLSKLLNKLFGTPLYLQDFGI